MCSDSLVLRDGISERWRSHVSYSEGQEILQRPSQVLRRRADLWTAVSAQSGHHLQVYYTITANDCVVYLHFMSPPFIVVHPCVRVYVCSGALMSICLIYVFL